MDYKKLLHDIRTRPISFIPGKKVVSIAPGEWTSPYEGKGYEPLGYRDFEIGDDPRRINIPATARRGELTIVERVALRDFKIMVLVDPTPSMGVRDKLEIQLAAAGLLLYSAWQSETTFGLAVCINNSVYSYGMGIGSRHFYNLYRRLLGIVNSKQKEYLKGTRKLSLSRCLPPNAMLLYCSDFLASNGQLTDLSVLKRSVQRYDFIPVIIQDEFEYSFPLMDYGTFIAFTNPETGAKEEAWLSPKKSVDIRSLHESRFQELISAMGPPGIRSIHLDEANIQTIGENIDRFFRRRTNKAV
jgi:uncharacterized protein (DUF58 family)